MSFLDTFTGSAAAADLDMEAELLQDSKISWIGFKRTSSNNITIRIGIEVGDVRVDIVIQTGSAVQDIGITDQFDLPAGSKIHIETTGIVAGTVDGVVVANQSAVTR